VETVKPLAETLALHEGFVRALARGVLGADDRVEDVVQETWRIALEKAPRDPGRLRSWLGTVARNLALTIRRRDRSRVRRDPVTARGEAQPATVEIAQREETRRRLVGELLALPEPYRTVLLLRYYENLPPREIARRLGVPRETVRTRVRRGLERLRARVPASVALAALARTSHAAAALTGAVAMKKTQVLAALAALVLAAGGRAAWQALREGEPSRAPDRAAVRESPEPAAPVPKATTQETPRSSTTAVDPGETGAVRLRGRLVCADRPVTGRAGITVRGVVEQAGFLDQSLSVETGPDGTFAIDVVPLAGADHLEVRADHPLYLPKTVRAGAGGAVLRIDLARAAVLVGQVRHADGSPAAGAHVALSSRGMRVTSLDDTGRYAIDVQPGLEHEITVHAPGAEDYRKSATLEPGEARRLHVALEREAQAAPALEVRLRGPVRPGTLALGLCGSHPYPSQVGSAPVRDGVARFDELEPGTWRAVVRAGKSYYGSLAYVVDARAHVESSCAPARPRSSRSSSEPADACGSRRSVRTSPAPARRASSATRAAIRSR